MADLTSPSDARCIICDEKPAGGSDIYWMPAADGHEYGPFCGEPCAQTWLTMDHNTRVVAIWGTRANHAEMLLRAVRRGDIEIQTETDAESVPRFDPVWRTLDGATCPRPDNGKKSCQDCRYQHLVEWKQPSVRYLDNTSEMVQPS